MPRLGLGSVDLSALGGTGQDVVTAIDDFFFESNASGEVTPIYTASRKQFARNNNDVAGLNNVTKDTSITVPPGQTGTAIRLTEDTSNSQHFATTVIDEVTAGDTYTMSLYVKSTYSSIQIYTNTTQISSNVTVNFTNETIATSALRAGIEDAGGGWYRVNWTQVAQASGSSLIYLVVKDLSSYTGSTSNFTDYFGMQVEQDSRASSFMLNTTSDVLTVSTTLNDTSEVWDFDSTDIMLEADPEDEGFWEEGSNLVLNHDYADLGSELVTNGDFSQIGSEEVTNGDFANWSGGLPNSWDQLGGSGDANNYIEEYQGKLRVVSNGGSGAAVEQNALTVGKIYKVTADLVVNSGGGMRFQLGANSTHHIYTTTQSIEFYAECDGTNGYLQIIRQGTTDFTIDNVSVKEVGQNWTFANDATMGNDVATIIGDSSTAGYIIQDNVFQSNKTYKCIFDVTINSGLGLKFQDGLSYSPHNENIGLATTSGVYTFYFNSTSYNQLAIIRRTGGTAYDSIINSVSVKQVDPNDRWSLGTGWSIEDGKLKGDGTNTDFQSAQQNNVTTVGDTYEVTVTVEATSGAVELKGSGVYTRIDSLGIGTHTFYVVADATYIRFLAHASSTITLDNFTVREYAIQPQDV